MLEPRTACECCGVELPPEAADAMICLFECTFCKASVDGEGVRACVRICAVQHPAVGFALADRAGLLQHGDGPAAQSLDRRSFLLRH
jgi:hypothetical protein